MTGRTYIVVLVLAAALGISAHRATAGENGRLDAQADRSLVAMKTLSTAAGSGSAGNAAGKAGVIEIWRDRVFETLGDSLGQRRSDEARAGWPTRGSESDGAAAQKRMVARAAVKETVKLALERMPEVERIVKALRFEVSTEQFTDGVSEQPAAGQTDAGPASSRPTTVRERFFVKTGLRIPIDNARPGLLSETSAVYGKFSSFFKLRLDGRNDARLGMRYDLSPDIHLLVERQVAHELPASQSIQLVCAF